MNLEQGREQGRRGSILEFAEARFGSLPEDFEPALGRISDEKALQRLVRAVATAESAEELLRAVRREGGA